MALPPQLKGSPRTEVQEFLERPTVRCPWTCELNDKVVIGFPHQTLLLLLLWSSQDHVLPILSNNAGTYRRRFYSYGLQKTIKVYGSWVLLFRNTYLSFLPVLHVPCCFIQHFFYHSLAVSSACSFQLLLFHPAIERERKAERGDLKAKFADCSIRESPTPMYNETCCVLATSKE